MTEKIALNQVTTKDCYNRLLTSLTELVEEYDNRRIDILDAVNTFNLWIEENFQKESIYYTEVNFLWSYDEECLLIYRSPSLHHDIVYSRFDLMDTIEMEDDEVFWFIMQELWSDEEFEDFKESHYDELSKYKAMYLLDDFINRLDSIDRFEKRLQEKLS